MKTYCIRQKKQTGNIPGSKEYIRAKNGRFMVRNICSECHCKKTQFVGRGVVDSIADTGLEMFIQHGIPWLGKKAVEIGRYTASEALRNKKVQKAITNKAKQLSHKGLDYALDSLSSDIINKASDKLRPKGYKKGGNYEDWYPMEMYSDVTDPMNPLYQRGEGLPIPFPFVDFKKAWEVLRAPGLFKGPEVSEKEGRALVAEYKRQ